MQTPVYDFVRDYARSDTVRLHMPGHKGVPQLGCEPFDITEISGADALYEADGIIAQSQRCAAALFGSRATVYGTEGSSQCIRAMVHLAVTRCRRQQRPYLLAARNAHKSFLYALALADADVRWLWPETACSFCSCPVTAAQVQAALQDADELPAAVYLTSPDYLGGMLPLREIADVCHRYGVPLLVDNAHGAYLHFLSTPLHPMDAGADLCCDSAHKTLPVLTGGAYLHIGKAAPASFSEHAAQAMALFGSTSPSYLTLASLDLCNRTLSQTFREQLEKTVSLCETVKQQLLRNGWRCISSEPLKITLRAPEALTGIQMAERLRKGGVECEYADREHLVLMVSPNTEPMHLQRLVDALGTNDSPQASAPSFAAVQPERVLSVREALYAPQKLLDVNDALGCVCAAPVVSCPPAIAVAVSGERIDAALLELLIRCDMGKISVVDC